MDVINWLLVILVLLLVITAAGHALLYKRDPKSAWGWIAVCLMFPVIGPLLYFFFGINRVKIRAKQLDQCLAALGRHLQSRTVQKNKQLSLPENVLSPEFLDIVRIADAVTLRPLVGGNLVEILHNGEEAYPAMLKAIDEAQQSVYLATYIFDTDHSGMSFIEALTRAEERGVMVQVIIDGIGELYSSPRARTVLQQHGIRVARFIPPTLLPPALHVNLRNHRKILVADSSVAFAGGMNIGDRHLVAVPDQSARVMDAHFRLTGPIVHQVEQVFRDDWTFCTGERLTPSTGALQPTGSALCRAIADAPSEELEKLAIILVGAVSAARKRVFIMTPYFLPSRELIGAMQTAALRGVEVVVLLPEKNNLPFIKWATSNMLWEILQRGVRVYYQPPPFAHTKLFIVDDYYALIGSANIDPRGLRLNFELTVEVYDPVFVATLANHFHNRIRHSSEITLAQVDARSIPIRVRDSLIWLFSPYL